MTPAVVAVSAFFPCYNDEPTIAAMVQVVLGAIDRCGITDSEVIVVNDGSTDGSAAVLAELACREPRLRVVTHERNRGYGGALLSGFAAATKQWVFYTDGDGQYDPTELEALVRRAAEDVDIVQGYKLRRADGVARTIVGRTYHWFVKMAFGLEIRDTDCDFRLIRRTKLDDVELVHTTGAITVELGHRVARRTVHPGLLTVHVRRESLVPARVLGEYPAAVTGAAGLVHGAPLHEAVAVDQAAPRRLRLAHVAVPAARMAARARLLKGRLHRGPAVGRAKLHERLLTAHGEVEAGLHVGHLLGVARTTRGVGPTRGPGHQACVCAALVSGGGVACVAAPAAARVVCAAEECRLHEESLPGLPRPGWGTASALAQLFCRRVWRRQGLEPGGVRVAGDAGALRGRRRLGREIGRLEVHHGSRADEQEAEEPHAAPDSGPRHWPILQPSDESKRCSNVHKEELSAVK